MYRLVEILREWILRFGVVEIWRHPIFPLGITLDIILAILPYIMLIGILKVQGSEIAPRKKGFVLIPLGIVYMLFLPNATYLALEFKHIFIVDGIADSKSLGAIVFFVLVSVFGGLLSLEILQKTWCETKICQKRPLISLLVLSYSISMGTTLGLLRLSSLMGIFNLKLILLYSATAISDPFWKYFVVIFSLVIGLLTLVWTSYRTT